MRLLQVMNRLGYGFRQHLAEEGWGGRKLTVVDLTKAQQAALDRGGPTELMQCVAAEGEFIFPAADVTAPLPRAADVVAARDNQPRAQVVVPLSNPALRHVAEKLVAAIAEHCGVRLPIIDDTGDMTALLAADSLIVIGGAHENQMALQMATRYRTGFVDASVPGKDGWLVTTHMGLDSAGHNVVQIAASPDRAPAAVACVLGHLIAKDDAWLIRRVHRVEPGAALRARFPSWQQFIESLPAMIPWLEPRTASLPTDPEALSHVLAKGLDSGGFEINRYNAGPIDIAIKVARYYQISADERGIVLLRALLFRLSDYYLKTPQGASYPSDLDFRIGTLLLYFSRLEHHPIFSDDDRLILTNVLLACHRAVHAYALACWPIDPSKTTHFNHQTFKALCLAFGADYFSRYGIIDVDAWRTYTNSVFTDDLWSRTKQIENAGTYELLVYDHAAAHRLFTGGTLGPRERNCLKSIVQRQMATTDNFFRPVDYGDAGLKMKQDCTGMARLVALDDDDPRIRWFAEEDLVRFGEDLPLFLHEHPGLRQPQLGAAPPVGDWEWTPLDSAFAADFAPALPPSAGFDKLAFRTGWTDDSQYVLWEGVGNLEVGHAHNEVNGIVRINGRGRHWVVSNGYGRRPKVASVLDSFKTRERGPVDHNMLVLKRDGKVVDDLPACATLLHRGCKGHFAWATAAVFDYGGVDWFRTALICADVFVLVLDRVRGMSSDLESAHVEWNCLGQCVPAAEGYALEQQGVFMHVHSASNWSSTVTSGDQSACWQAVLGSQQYPYATFPLSKLSYHMPLKSQQPTCALATLMAVSDAPESPLRMTHTDEVITLKNLPNEVGTVDAGNDDLTLKVGEICELTYQPTTDLPDNFSSK